jgi:hypothetical protein
VVGPPHAHELVSEAGRLAGRHGVCVCMFVFVCRLVVRLLRGWYRWLVATSCREIGELVMLSSQVCCKGCDQAQQKSACMRACMCEYAHSVADGHLMHRDW